MPKLKIEAPQSGDASNIAPRLVAQYRKYIDRIKPVGVGLLVFSPSEDMKLGKEAIEAAAAQAKVQVSVRKARAQERTWQIRVSNNATGPKKPGPKKGGRPKKEAAAAS